ncbi:PP2C family protein-serine/threonine phosphatase [Streptomyces sp. NPDC051976]|uniref:PP2C family protein-serine/threonine phosphatase n=1 Tax=Streptomyces sp. NPDC051976 TaxID=3154947 RepID=UPI0034168722
MLLSTRTILLLVRAQADTQERGVPVLWYCCQTCWEISAPLVHLDDLVIRLIGEESSGNGATATTVLGATCLYAVYDPVNGRCVAARAGHIPPAVVTSEGKASFPELPAGPPLGLGTLPFESGEFELDEGSLLALFTDGLVESRSRDVESGLNQLAEVLSHPKFSLEEVCDTVLSEMHCEPQVDDLALIVARAHTLGPEQVATWELAADPAGVREPARIRSHVVNDTHCGIHDNGRGRIRSGGRGMGDFGDDVQAPTQSGDSASYAFAVIGIDVPRRRTAARPVRRSPSTGVPPKPSASTPPVRPADLFTTRGLSVGQHAITVTRRSGTWRLLDGFSVPNWRRTGCS